MKIYNFLNVTVSTFSVIEEEWEEADTLLRETLFSQLSLHESQLKYFAKAALRN